MQHLFLFGFFKNLRIEGIIYLPSSEVSFYHKGNGTNGDGK